MFDVDFEFFTTWYKEVVNIIIGMTLCYYFNIQIYICVYKYEVTLNIDVIMTHNESMFQVIKIPQE